MVYDNNELGKSIVTLKHKAKAIMQQIQLFHDERIKVEEKGTVMVADSKKLQEYLNDLAELRNIYAIDPILVNKYHTKQVAAIDPEQPPKVEYFNKVVTVQDQPPKPVPLVDIKKSKPVKKVTKVYCKECNTWINDTSNKGNWQRHTKRYCHIRACEKLKGNNV